MKLLLWITYFFAAIAIGACGFYLKSVVPLTVLTALIVFGITVFVVANLSRQSRRNALVAAINTLPANVGFTKMRRRYLASAAITTRYLFVKAGADDEHIAAITATADKPVGVCSDEAAAAEDPVTVELAGINGQTLPCVAGAAIASLNLDVYTDTAGKVVGKPTAAGTYWKVGRNLTLATAANDPVEVQLCEPRKLIVIAALTSTNGTAAAASASLANLAAETEKVGDDLRAIAAALDGNADVALATT
jgi:hypothetical protein